MGLRINRDEGASTALGSLRQNSSAQARLFNKLSTGLRINTAADIPQHWTASAWLLERTFPERYALNGPRVLSENASDTGGVIPMQIAVQIQHARREVMVLAPARCS